MTQFPVHGLANQLWIYLKENALAIWSDPPPTPTTYPPFLPCSNLEHICSWEWHLVWISALKYRVCVYFHNGSPRWDWHPWPWVGGLLPVGNKSPLEVRVVRIQRWESEKAAAFETGVFVANVFVAYVRAWHHRNVLQTFFQSIATGLTCTII